MKKRRDDIFLPRETSDSDKKPTLVLTETIIIIYYRLPRIKKKYIYVQYEYINDPLFFQLNVIVSPHS